jgi:hypothetical protein
MRAEREQLIGFLKMDTPPQSAVFQTASTTSSGDLLAICPHLLDQPMMRGANIDRRTVEARG